MKDGNDFLVLHSSESMAIPTRPEIKTYGIGEAARSTLTALA